MSIKHNFLRMYRRKSKLTQGDVAYILDHEDFSTISKWELGKRQPDLQTAFLFHLLYDIPIEELFARQVSSNIEPLSNRIKTRRDILKAHRPDGKGLKRIEYLTDALTRLAALQAPDA
jgi:transcriptional regulator with XRE-family HTH domain